ISKLSKLTTYYNHYKNIKNFNFLFYYGNCENVGALDLNSKDGKLNQMKLFTDGKSESILKENNAKFRLLGRCSTLYQKQLENYASMG
ncbi:hypothetical protein P4517_33955, partial [Bacillus thuringiensis]